MRGDMTTWRSRSASRRADSDPPGRKPKLPVGGCSSAGPTPRRCVTLVVVAWLASQSATWPVGPRLAANTCTVVLPRVAATSSVTPLSAWMVFPLATSTTVTFTKPPVTTGAAIAIPTGRVNAAPATSDTTALRELLSIGGAFLLMCTPRSWCVAAHWFGATSRETTRGRWHAAAIFEEADGDSGHATPRRGPTALAQGEWSERTLRSRGPWPQR